MYCIDASVLTNSVIVNEEFHEYSKGLLTAIKEREIMVVVPEIASAISQGTRSKNPVIYHRGDRRGRRVLRPSQFSLWFSDASAFSAYSAVKLKDIMISLEFSIVPQRPIKDQTTAIANTLGYNRIRRRYR